MKLKLAIVIALTLLLMSMSIVVIKIRPVRASSEETVVHYDWSEITYTRSSFNDTDPDPTWRRFGEAPLSGEANVMFSSPDENGVINITIPKESSYTKPLYDPAAHQTLHIVSISGSYGKLYTVGGKGDVDIKSKTNDTGTFFWKDGAWHSPGEEWLGDGTLDPAGSAWLTGIHNASVYYGNGTDGPLIARWVEQTWLTTGFSENTVVEPASRLNGFYVNATGVPFSSPYVGSIGTWVHTGAKLNIPFFYSLPLDLQSKTDQCSVTPPAFTATVLSPANLYVTDPENKHIGTHPTTGQYVNEILGAFYSGPGSHPQRIVIPNPLDGVYDIEIIGTSTGSYTLVVELATPTETTTQVYTGNIVPEAILRSKATVSEGEITSTTPVSTIGDVNVDGIVNIIDIGVCTKAFGSYLGDPRWNPIADINMDGIINIFDLVMIGINFGKTA